MTFNLEKTKKHMKMAQEIRRKQNEMECDPGDMYGIDSALIIFAYKTISTKELKKLIKKEEEEMDRTK